MLKLDKTENSQTFAITSRVDISTSTTGVVEYTREGTETVEVSSVELNPAGYYTTATASFSGLTEDSVYTFIVKLGSDEIHRGEFFASSQDVQSYKINNNNYSYNSTDNDYIIFE